MATGHYARLTGSHRRLSRGSTTQKDQSYVLAEVTSLLERGRLPLGRVYQGRGKRDGGRRAGVEPLVSEESQEICFIPDDDYRAFLRAGSGSVQAQ